MLNCKQATALMSQCIDKKLGPLQKINLRFHLMMCSGCRNYNKQMMFLCKSCEQFPQQGSLIEQLNNE